MVYITKLFVSRASLVVIILITISTPAKVFAQSQLGANYHTDRAAILWASEAEVISRFGQPLSKSPLVGTHAKYSLWKYPSFTVAFADNRVLHLFDTNSLHRTVELEQSN